MSHADVFEIIVASVEKKLAAAIEIYSLTSYAEAKAKVLPTTTAGEAVRQYLDAKYTTNNR